MIFLISCEFYYINIVYPSNIVREFILYNFSTFLPLLGLVVNEIQNIFSTRLVYSLYEEKPCIHVSSTNKEKSATAAATQK